MSMEKTNKVFCDRVLKELDANFRQVFPDNGQAGGALQYVSKYYTIADDPEEFFELPFMKGRGVRAFQTVLLENGPSWVDSWEKCCAFYEKIFEARDGKQSTSDVRVTSPSTKGVAADSPARANEGKPFSFSSEGLPEHKPPFEAKSPSPEKGPQAGCLTLDEISGRKIDNLPKGVEAVKVPEKISKAPVKVEKREQQSSTPAASKRTEKSRQRAAEYREKKKAELQQKKENNVKKDENKGKHEKEEKIAKEKKNDAKKKIESSPGVPSKGPVVKRLVEEVEQPPAPSGDGPTSLNMLPPPDGGDEPSDSDDSAGPDPEGEGEAMRRLLGGVRYVLWEPLSRVTPVLQNPINTGALISLTKRKGNLHGISAFWRDFGFDSIVADAVINDSARVILDWNGADRNRTRLGVRSNGRRTVKGEIEFTFHTNRTFSKPGDAARNSSPSRFYEGPADAVIVQDHYLDLANEDHSFSVRSLDRIRTAHSPSKIHILNREFEGDIGVEAYRFDVKDGGEIHWEGFWKRRDDGRIAFRPDAVDGFFEAHHDTNWIMHRKVGDWSLTFKRAYGPYRHVVAVYEAGSPEAVEPIANVLGEKRVIRPNFWRQFLHPVEAIRFKIDQYMQAQQSYRVAVGVLAKAGPLTAKTGYGHNLDSVVSMVSTQMMSNPRWAAIATIDPDEFRRYNRDTAFYILHAEKSDVADTLDTLAKYNSRAEETLIAARNPGTKYPYSPWIWAVGGVLVCALGYYVYKRGVSAPLVANSVTEIAKEAGKKASSLWDKCSGVLSGALGWAKSCVPSWESIKSLPRRALKAGAELFAGGLLATARNLYNTVDEFCPNGIGFLASAVTGACVEETLRIFFPVGISVLLAGWEGVIGAMVHGIPTGVFKVCFHSLLFFLPPQLRFAAHIGWNGYVGLFGAKINNLQPGSLFHTWLDAYYHCEHVPELRGQEPIRRGEVIQSMRVRQIDIPPWRGTMTLQKDGWTEKIDSDTVESLQLFIDREMILCPFNPVSDYVMHPIIVTSGLLWMPEKCDINLIAALTMRLHQDPFIGRDPAPKRWSRWKDTTRTMLKNGVFGPRMLDRMSFDQAMKEMGSKADRIIAAREQWEDGHRIKLRKTVNLKWNETIPAKTFANGVRGIKPRAIVDLDPEYHAYLAAISRSMTDHLHEYQDGKHIVVLNQIPVAFCFASGFTAKELDDVVRTFGDHVTVMVAGDDSLVHWGAYSEFFGGQPFGEGDFSMFDSTQDEGPTIFAARIRNQHLGMDPWELAMLEESINQPYRINLKKTGLRVGGECGVVMPTGSTVTTGYNSQTTITVFAYAVLNRVPLQQAAQDLGLTLKYTGSDYLSDATFLKGWWMRDVRGGFRWLPLPSLAVKIGKVLRPPEHLVEKRYKKCALEVVAYAISNSFGHIPQCYPILGTLCHKMRTLGVQGRVKATVLESWQKPIVTEKMWLDVPFCYEQMEKRYGLSTSLIEDATILIQNITALPAFVASPVFVALSRRDYGDGQELYAPN